MIVIGSLGNFLSCVQVYLFCTVYTLPPPIQNIYTLQLGRYVCMSTCIVFFYKGRLTCRHFHKKKDPKKVMGFQVQ